MNGLFWLGTLVCISLVNPPKLKGKLGREYLGQPGCCKGFNGIRGHVPHFFLVKKITIIITTVTTKIKEI
jgi:hypothetical protein